MSDDCGHWMHSGTASSEMQLKLSFKASGKREARLGGLLRAEFERGEHEFDGDISNSRCDGGSMHVSEAVMLENPQCLRLS